MADPLLVGEPDPPSTATSRSTAPDRPATAAQRLATTSRPATIPNSRKGYKLTLWVSATTEGGLADAHGLLQLDGADPVPFCQLRGVQNPLARALQEAYLAIQRVRAKPPRMNAPATGSATITRPHAPPTRPTPAPATGPESPPRSPAPPSTPSESVAANKRKPVGQPTLF